MIIRSKIDDALNVCLFVVCCFIIVDNDYDDDVEDDNKDYKKKSRLWSSYYDDFIMIIDRVDVCLNKLP